MEAAPVSALVREQRIRIFIIAIIAIAAIFSIQWLNHDSRERWFQTASLETLKGQLKENPSDDELAYHLSYRLIGRGDASEASAIMEQVVKRNPNSLVYLAGLARCTAAASRIEETTALYKKILTINPNDAEAHAYLGEIYGKAALYREGLKEIHEAQKLKPKITLNQEVYLNCLIHLGKWQEAWTALTNSLNFNPVQDGYYETLFQIAAHTGNLSQCENLIKRRIGITPMYPVGGIHAELAMTISSESSDGEHFADAIMENRQEIWPALRARTEGEILLDSGQPAPARNALLRAAHLDHKDIRIPELLAEADRALGLEKEAAQMQNRIALLKGLTPRIMGMQNEAKLSPHNINLMLDLAQALQKNHNYGKAAEEYDIILLISPQDSTAAAMLPLCREEALKQLDERIQKNTKS